jgi:hypothetical protein
MNQDIIDKFLSMVDIVGGKAKVSIHRADGKVDGPYDVKNQVTAAGLNELTAKTIVTSRPPFVNIAVGSGTAAGSLGSTALIHEVVRKAGATQTTSRSTIILTNTFGGAADSITSVALEEAGIFNSVSSGQGIMLNKLTGVNATLANSDILSLEMTYQIGSHAL